MLHVSLEVLNRVGQMNRNPQQGAERQHEDQGGDQPTQDRARVQGDEGEEGDVGHPAPPCPLEPHIVGKPGQRDGGEQGGGANSSGTTRAAAIRGSATARAMAVRNRTCPPTSGFHGLVEASRSRSQMSLTTPIQNWTTSIASPPTSSRDQGGAPAAAMIPMTTTVAATRSDGNG